MSKATGRRRGKVASERGQKMAKLDELRVVVFQDGDLWVAQCLEYDIGAQGSTLPELRSRFEATLNAERAESVKAHGAAFAGIEAAPPMYEDMWNKCGGIIYVPAAPVSSPIPFRMAMCA